MHGRANDADTDADNVYLREFLAQDTHAAQPAGDGYASWLRRAGRPSAYDRRLACVRRYAFGIPNRDALGAIARHAPIVELGAGTGYWAYLLRNRGVDIVAYDLAPPDQAPNAYSFDPRTWTQVWSGGVEVLDRYANRALFLCWPGYRDTFADEALRAYSGAALIYVGEGPGGNTASTAFFERLARDWVADEEIALPQWAGADDAMTIYHRTTSSSRTM